MKLKEKQRHITTAAMLNVRYTFEDLKQFIGVELFNQWALTCHMQLRARITPYLFIGSCSTTYIGQNQVENF